MIRLATFNRRESPELFARYILSHPFNRKVSFAIVNGQTEAFKLASPGFHTAELGLSDLVSEPFLNFINAHPGSLIATITDADLSTSRWIAAISNDNCLWISLSKHAYEGFGLEGHATESKKYGIERYVVRVDLNDERLKNTEGSYSKRVVSCLNRLSTLPTTFHLSFDSQATYDAFLKSFKFTSSPCNYAESNFKSIAVPSFPDVQQIGRDCDTSDFIELDLWAGCLFNRLTDVLEGVKPDPFISVCTFDEETFLKGDVVVGECQYQVHPKLIFDAVTAANEGDLIVLRVIGNPNSPGTWDNQCNRQDDRRDSTHGYLLFISPQTDDCIVFQYSAATLRKA